MAAGTQNLRDQLRLLLMISQVQGGQGQYIPYPSQPLTIRAARLQALTRMAASLTDAQINRLLRDVMQMGHGAVRLNLLIDLIAYVSESQARLMIRDVWNQSATVVDPVARAHILFRLAPYVSRHTEAKRRPSVLMQVLDIVMKLSSLEARVRGIAAISKYLPADLFESKLKPLLRALQATHNDTLIGRTLMALAPHIPTPMLPQAQQTANQIKDVDERARALTLLARYVPVHERPQLHEDALATIAQLDEDERADALTAFAPNLQPAFSDQGYPDLLERALTIAISIAQRPLRARVLVALVPHLTADLQREALAAVRSLSSERERALLMQRLIPTLPAELLHEGLAISETMHEPDYRVQILTCLAQALAEDKRQPVLDTALRLTSELQNPYEQVRTLVELLPYLSVEVRQTALQNTLDVAASLDNSPTRARMISLLGSHLDNGLMEHALSLAHAIEHPQYRLNALLGLLPHVQQRSEVISELLTCVRQISQPYKRASALIAMLPYLPQPKVLQALALVDVLTDPLDEIYVYVTAAQHLAPRRRHALMERIIQKLDGIEDGYNRASAMMMIAPHIDDATQRFKPLIISTILKSEDEYDRASTLTVLAPLLEGDVSDERVTLPDQLMTLKQGFETSLKIPQQDLRAHAIKTGVDAWLNVETPTASYELWCTLAGSLINLPLTDVVLCIDALLPLLVHFYGDDARKVVAYLLGLR